MQRTRPVRGEDLGRGDGFRTNRDGLKLGAHLASEAVCHREHLEGQHRRRSGDVVDKCEDHGQSNRSR